MSYSIEEIFYTLQGEVAHAGSAAVLLHFSGGNLWNGREADRGRGRGGCAARGDTDFLGTGPTGGKCEASGELAIQVKNTWQPGPAGYPWVLCTGGKPRLQLDKARVSALNQVGFEVAVDTNGTQRVTSGSTGSA